MSLSAIAAGSPSNIADLLKQRRQDLQTMESAVQSGNVTAAQQALATVQADSQNLRALAGSSAGHGGGNPYQSTMKTDLSGLMAAAQSGDMGGAQQALQQYQQDQQALIAGNPTGTPGASAGGDKQNSFLNDLQSLIGAVQSGDAGGAKTAAAALQKDIAGSAGAKGVGHHHHHGGGGGDSAQPSSTTDGTATSQTQLTSLAAAATGSANDRLAQLLSAFSNS
jgi:ribosomal protein S20